jgi:hypothetical protein
MNESKFVPGRKRWKQKLEAAVCLHLASTVASTAIMHYGMSTRSNDALRSTYSPLLSKRWRQWKHFLYSL